jgi:hypothetical protein
MTKFAILALSILALSFKSYSFEISFQKVENINKIFSSNHADTHQVNLDVYLFAEDEDEYQRLIIDLETAQSLISACRIRIQLNQKITLKGDRSIREFESVEFNGGRLSPHEKAFFNLVKNYTSGILLVESLDWTIGEDGTVAVGYAPYILDLSLMQLADERKFLKEKMSGYSILGKSRSSHTLAHELGHSLFNLTHVNDPGNIMFPYGFARAKKAQFSESQCVQARSHQPWVKKRF